MGIFSDKVKTVRGISFTSVVQDTREEYIQFKRELLAAMIQNFSVRRYAYELWKYRKNVRHRYKANKLDVLVGGIQNKSITKVDNSVVLNYLKSHGANDIVRVTRIKERKKVNQADVGTTPDAVAEFELSVKIWDEHKPLFPTEDIPVGTDGGFDRYFPIAEKISYHIVNNGINDSVELVTMFRKVSPTIEEWRPIGSGIFKTGTRANEVMNPLMSLDIDVKEYYFHTAKYLTHGVNHGSLPIKNGYIPANIATAPPSYVASFYDIAPMLQVKGLNSGTATSDDKKVMRQLKAFGIGIESIQSLLDNDSVKDFKVGLMVSPHDALTSKPITKYLFHFFDSLPIPATDDYSDVFLAKKDGFKFSQNVGNSSYTTTFSITKSISAGTIPNANQKTYRLKIRQNIPNNQRFYKHVKEVHDDVLAGLDAGNTKTTKQLYDDIVTAARNNPTNQALQDARNELPSVRATSVMKPVKYIVINCNVGQHSSASVDKRSANITYGDDEAKTVIYDILTVKEIKDFPSAGKYSTEKTKGYEYNEFYDDYLENGDPKGKPKEIFAIEFHYQHSPTHYTTISYSNGKIEYTTDSGTVVQRHTEEDTEFRLPMIRDALKGVAIYEFHELYSKCFIGLAFTVQKIRIKWYQRSIFKVILQIVLVVIAVAVTVITGGAGATVGSALVSVALNMAVGYAVAAIVTYVLDTFGVDTTWVGVVIAVLQIAYSGTVTGEAMVQLGLSLADAAVQLEMQNVQEDSQRLQEEHREFQKMMDKKMKELKEKLETFSGDIFNLVKESPEYDDMMLTSPSYALEIPEGLAEMQERTAWKLPEVGAVSFNQSDQLGQNWFNINPQFEVNLRIGEIHTFGVAEV